MLVTRLHQKYVSASETQLTVTKTTSTCCSTEFFKVHLNDNI